MLALALAALLFAPPDEPRPAPDPKAVEAVVKELKGAFAGDEVDAMLAAVRKAEAFVHADVVAALKKGLKEERRVQEATLEALRFMDHPAALEALHDAYEKEAVADDEALLTLLLKAIGQHASTSSIEVLSDDAWAAQSRQVLEARILGLGRIRDRRSVEALMGIMQKAGRAWTADHMDGFRLALLALTGSDQGRSRDAWVAWWNKHRKTFEVPADPPPLPEALERRWNAYWQAGRAADRGRQGGERGDGGRGG